MYSRRTYSSKYFEKSTEKLNSASGSKLQIRYELNNAHVCQNNVCFHIPSVLVKNMTDKVILGIPFIFMLYHFKAKLDGIFTVKMGVPVKFHFASKFEIDISQLSLNLIHARTLPYLGVPSGYTFKIVETNASEIGFRGVPKQLVSPGPLNKLFNSILDPGFLRNIIIALLRNFLRYFIAYFAQWQVIFHAFDFIIDYIKKF